jgi:DNA-binding GntR family transcriptional regulator
MILRGELPPGSSIARRPLAEKLGVSFLPVSEALQRLEHEGMVESWPRVGTRVKVPSAQDVRGNYVIREALESQSARLFAEKASAAERDEMRRMASQVDARQADPRVDFFDFFSLHERFHRRLAECAGCPALVDALQKTNTLIRTWQYAALSDYRTMPSHYHEALVEALSEGNVEVADRAMREHVRHGMEEVLQRMGPYFEAGFACLPGAARRRPARTRS